jgi:GT2 family glycosyltransferase
MSDTAVVVLNYNGRHLLEPCLDSVRRQTWPATIVVADNGSTDESLAWLRAEQPDVQVVDLGRNLGFAAGYNRALEAVSQPWLVLLNNDATLAPDWIEQLRHYAAAQPKAAILGGKLLFDAALLPADSDGILQSAGASFTSAGTGFEIGWGQPDTGQYDTPGPVGAIPAAAMLVKRDVFVQLGGFEPDHHAYLEDVDLCWRAWLRGHEVHYVPQAVARHRYGASGGGRRAPFRIRWMQRNRLANMLKNLEWRSLPGALAVSLSYDAWRMLEYAARADWPALGALAAGSLLFWRDMPTILARRRQVQRSRCLGDRALREHGLMVPALKAFREYRRLASGTGLK